MRAFGTCRQGSPKLKPADSKGRAMRRLVAILMALLLVLNLALFASGMLEALHFWVVVLAVLLASRALLR